jgi:hypothetical protein
MCSSLASSANLLTHHNFASFQTSDHANRNLNRPVTVIETRDSHFSREGVQAKHVLRYAVLITRTIQQTRYVSDYTVGTQERPAPVVKQSSKRVCCSHLIHVGVQRRHT